MPIKSLVLGGWGGFLLEGVEVPTKVGPSKR